MDFAVVVPELRRPLRPSCSAKRARSSPAEPGAAPAPSSSAGSRTRPSSPPAPARTSRTSTGTTYVDYQMGQGPLILGHRPPDLLAWAVTRAINERLGSHLSPSA